MQAQTATQKNENGTKTVKQLHSAKPAEKTKEVDVLAVIEKFKPEPAKTPEERIQKAKQFGALSERYNALKEKDQELKTFHAGNDKTNAKIVFQNSQGYSFEVRNSAIINRLTLAAGEELQILLDEADNEIMTFQM